MSYKKERREYILVTCIAMYGSIDLTRNQITEPKALNYVYCVCVGVCIMRMWVLGACSELQTPRL